MFQKITSYLSAIVLALTLTACANTGGSWCSQMTPWWK